MNILNSKYGCWIVNGIPFVSKIDALFYANQINSQNIYFYFHDHIWENFDRKLLGKIPLSVLYKERAQQLRDSYDYLVLHYSGGSDSHNILHTFLENKIKLDEVSVRWAKPLVDGKFYTPNQYDTSAKNGMSEWDFAIKPELDKLKVTNPEIKINIVDFTDKFDSKLTTVDNIEKRIFDLGMKRGALGSFAQRLDPNFESKVTLSKSDNTCHIYGVEKPMVFLNGNSIDFCFQDAMMDVALMPNVMSNNSLEMFYWTPDLPLLPLEQAYQVALYLKEKHQRLLNLDHYSPNNPYYRKQLDELSQAQKYILYKDSWDFNKFQVGKPNSARSDWWFWLHETQEIRHLAENFKIAMNNIASRVDQRMLIDAEGASVFYPVRTKNFKLLDL